ncbi:MAG: HAD family hydrolase [Gammaproteobacteria bacterium]|nr:HAD family hydrolase [Gammaproteobacteria bacterium]
MVVSDLDGTLLDSGHALSEQNRRTLDWLAERGAVRVVATGRSWFSARQVLDDDFPIDFLIFSSGAGVIDWSSKALILAHDMRGDDALAVAGSLVARGLDFMLHHGIPDNHRFYFHRAGRDDNPDFEARCARYRDFATPWPGESPSMERASQLLVVEPAGVPSQFHDIAASLPSQKVILTTSPLDHASRWIEIFPASVSKANAATWLCERLGCDPRQVLAVGNDFNDLDLLDWAASARVVANAPARLRETYENVPSNDAHGFSRAVRDWVDGRAL